MMSDCWPEHFDCDHRECIGMAVTLDGEPAKIVKDREGYAKVVTLDGWEEVGFSWGAVHSVVNHGEGKFHG